MMLAPFKSSTVNNMINLLQSKSFIFDKNSANLALMQNAILFSKADLEVAQTVLRYFKHNQVLVATIDLCAVQKLDSNSESFIYQVTRLFTDNPLKRLTVKSNDNCMIQRQVVNNLVQIMPAIQLEFII
jgi:hypothetical protein